MRTTCLNKRVVRKILFIVFALLVLGLLIFLHTWKPWHHPSESEERIRLIGFDLTRCPAGHQAIRLKPVILDGGCYDIGYLPPHSIDILWSRSNEKTPAYYAQCETCGCIYNPQCDEWTLLSDNPRNFPYPFSWPYSTFLPSKNASINCFQLCTSETLLREIIEYQVEDANAELYNKVTEQFGHLIQQRSLKIEKYPITDRPYGLIFQGKDGKKSISVEITLNGASHTLYIQWSIFHIEACEKYSFNYRIEHAPPYKPYGSKTYFFLCNLFGNIKKKALSIFR